MPRAFAHFALCIALAITATSASALGFGRVATRTNLGQPLDFVATLTLDADETLARECVSAEVFSGDNHIASPNVRATLEGAADGQRRVRVTTSVAIDEPVVAVEVTVGCTSRVTRRFVSFVDPPALRLANSSNDGLPSSEPRVDSRVASLADVAGRADRARRGVTADERRTERRRERRVTATEAAPTATARARTPQRRATMVASAGGARLRLDGPAPLPAIAAPAPAADPAVAAASASAPAVPTAPATPPGPLTLAIADASPTAVAAADAASQALQRERDRIQQLEVQFGKVLVEQQATQQTVATLQARLRQAESERYSNVLVYVLGAVALLFALLSLALWKLRPRQRRRARWFDAQASQQRAAEKAAPVAAVAAGDDAAEPAIASDVPRMPTSQWHAVADSTFSATFAPTAAPATIGGLEVTTVLGPEAARPLLMQRAGDVPDSVRGELSMEELIDLEQQAEFFIVLGQDEAAISLLEGYVRGEGGRSPLPYLQLLELHQRRADRDAYEQVRASFNDRFQAHAPDWNADLHFGRGLDDYPQTTAKLQSLWQTPLSAMRALDAMLFRRQTSDEAYDFPAYRELLFLYGVARELAGNVDTDLGAIDLFLPLEDATPSESQITPAEASWRGGPHAAATIDFDLSPDANIGPVTPTRG